MNARSKRVLGRDHMHWDVRVGGKRRKRIGCLEGKGAARARNGREAFSGQSQRTRLGEIILLLFVVPCIERLRLGQFLLSICQLTLLY